MTYRIDRFVKLIKAPIVCNVNGEALTFTNGEELAAHDFEKKYFIKSITIEDRKAVLNLTEKATPYYSRDDKSQVEEWIKRHIESYGKEPNLFDGN